MLERDLRLVELTGGRYHAAHVSTAEGIAAIRRAKDKGLNVTCDTAPPYFALDETAVGEYRTFAKLSPPLRAEADRAAVAAGLADGTIDAIATDHAPHALFEKEVEYTAAPFGILGLETCWGLVGRELIKPGILTVAQAVHKLAVAPREILGLAVPALEEGQPANVTVFDAETEWTFSASDIRSKSRNTPFVGAPMVGKAWGVYNRGRLVVSEGL